MAPVLTALLTSRGVKCVVVSCGNEQAVHKNGDVGEPLIAVATQMTAARAASEPAAKPTETILGHVFFRRQFGDATVCLVGDDTVSETEIDRRLNVAAIRLRAAALGQTTSPLVSALRAAFVGCTMPLSGRVFDRAIDDLRRAHRSLDIPTMRALVESLAAGLTAPSNETFMKETDALFRAAAEGSLRTTTSSLPPAVAPSVAPSAAKPRTIPPAALDAAAIEVMGPIGTMVVRRALGPVSHEPVDIDDALLRIGRQLTIPLRERLAERVWAAATPS